MSGRTEGQKGESGDWCGVRPKNGSQLNWPNGTFPSRRM